MILFQTSAIFTVFFQNNPSFKNFRLVRTSFQKSFQRTFPNRSKPFQTSGFWNDLPKMPPSRHVGQFLSFQRPFQKSFQRPFRSLRTRSLERLRCCLILVDCFQSFWKRTLRFENFFCHFGHFRRNSACGGCNFAPSFGWYTNTTQPRRIPDRHTVSAEIFLSKAV